MSANRILITDIDNTLFDWVNYFAPCFRAMVHAVSKTAGQPEEILYDQFKAVYAKAESIEFSWSIQRLEFCQSMSEEQVSRLVHTGRVAFGNALKSRLKPYQDVPGTLAWLHSEDVQIIGVTNSFIADALFRLRRLGIEKYFTGLVAWDGGDLQSHGSSERVARSSGWQSKTKVSKVIALSRNSLKPSASAYRSILEQLQVRPDAARVWVIGDSLAKDLAPGREIGAATIWAKYGQKVDQRNFETLLRITHWSTDKTKAVYDPESLEPDFTVESFSSLRSIIGEQQGRLFE